MVWEGKSFVFRWILNAILLFIVAGLLGGLELTGFWSVVAAGLVLGLANAIIRPLLIIISLPINVITLGLFTFVINALMLMLTARIVQGFTVDGFWPAVWAAVLMAIFGAIISGLVHGGRKNRSYVA